MKVVLSRQELHRLLLGPHALSLFFWAVPSDERELEIIWPKHVLDRRVKTIPSRAHPNSGASKLAKDGPRSGGQVHVTGGPVSGSSGAMGPWGGGVGNAQLS